MKRTIVCLGLCLLVPAMGWCQSQKKSGKTEQIVEMNEPGMWEEEELEPAKLHVRNVVFIIGDGMGTAQAYSSIVARGEKSNFLRFPVTGFSRTYSLDSYTTDSGAGGTALMTGHRVNNHAIAKGPDGTDYPSILQQAHDLGKVTGFVVTSSVLDATPASTYAHVSNRKEKDSISMQLAQSTINIAIGGDLNAFKKENRKDGKSPLDTLKARGIELVTRIDSLAESNSKRMFGLLTDENPDPKPERVELLCRGVEKALDVLNASENGFVLMIEGSQIDWACHNNDAQYLKAEMDDFENMLGIVLDFAEHDGNTLVVMTADHETGGLGLIDGNIENGQNECKFTTKGHTGVMVPVYAYGPMAKNFTGIHHNVEIPELIMKELKKQ